jgi:hypothetical protein
VGSEPAREIVNILVIDGLVRYVNFLVHACVKPETHIAPVRTVQEEAYPVCRPFLGPGFRQKRFESVLVLGSNNNYWLVVSRYISRIVEENGADHFELISNAPYFVFAGVADDDEVGRSQFNPRLGTSC